MDKKAILTIVFLLVSINIISALQTEEYLNHISSIIYQDCMQKNILLKDNWFIRADQKGFVTEFRWPYSLKNIQDTVLYISQSEPYSTNPKIMTSSGSITLNNKTYIDILGDCVSLSQ